MRLYSRTGATALDDPRHGRIEADPDHGGFDLPEELAEELRGFPAWETDVERQQRLVIEEIERRKDPATLLDAVQQLVRAAQTVNAAKQASTADETPAKASRARKASAARPDGSSAE
ncbi:hypothetical protein ACIRVF_08300 [Kitasatospora sp. NPDC101157]|uniref:hypothetical protein n=1 Tax=Kitasatospora sp. NPDC101157 TaxID=3364098 RepID=UPI00382689A9